jgi:SAM-dependent methyltransferase
MLINPNKISHQSLVKKKATPDRHSVSDRINPSVFQYDFLCLKLLRKDIETMLSNIDNPFQKNRIAVDIGSDKSPYYELLQGFGYQIKTLDITTDFGADFAGTAEESNLTENSVDLVICTQVLEHTRSPWKAMHEFKRILKPGGYVLFSVPHVWFYHPHPTDYWRMTQEGVVAICEDANFEVIQLRAQGGSIVGLFQVINFILYGGIRKFGAIIYAILNILAIPLDNIFKNTLFSINFACLAKTKNS